MKPGYPVRTAGNPIKMSTLSEIDPEVPIQSPALNEHREAILEELMANNGAYAPTTHAHEDVDDTGQVALYEAVSAV